MNFLAVVKQSFSTVSGGKRTFRNPEIHENEGPLSADTVEKLRFEISGDFICVLSIILYSRYEGVVEVR